MKKIIVILSAIALILGGCGQKSDKQAATAVYGADSSVSNDGRAAIETPDSGNTGIDLEGHFDSTLVGHEEGYVASDSVTTDDWKGVRCKWLSFDDGYTTRKECVFPGAKLQQVYNIVKKADPNLKIVLPAANLEYPCRLTNSGCVQVDYKYKSKKQLFIELLYEGGVTSVEITEGVDNTQAKITYSAD